MNYLSLSICSKGDMNVVESCPLLIRHLSRYTEHKDRRLGVRLGFTRHAQVNGWNSMTWEDNSIKMYITLTM